MRKLTQEDKDFVEEVVTQDAIISWRKDAGSRSLKIQGHPAALFAAVCEILEQIARADSEGNEERMRRYVETVCETVLEDLEET